jgi:hypothetical protein
MYYFQAMLLAEGRYYHIYNQGNNKEILFKESRNYLYFLRLWKQHISPIADTCAYHLLPNHFHIAICTKPDPEVSPKQRSRCFANMFAAYAKAINKGYERSGSLFQKNFRRKEIMTTDAFKRLIMFIHGNAAHHGLPNEIARCEHSSYGSLLSDKPTALQRDRVLQWFSGAASFCRAHADCHVQDWDLIHLFEDPRDDVHLFREV